MGFHILWKPMETSASETHGNPYLMETYGNLRTAMETTGNIWHPYIHTYGNIWKPVETRSKLFGYIWQHVVIMHGNLWKQYGAG
jgi:hypothetical protein